MPFIQWVYQHPKAEYAIINKGEIYIPQEIAERSIGIDCRLTEILTETGLNPKN